MISQRHLKRLVKKEQDKIFEELRSADRASTTVKQESLSSVADQEMDLLDSSSSKKMKKPGIKKEQEDSSCNVNCNCEKRVMKLEERIVQLEETIRRQTDIIAKALGEQKVIMKQLIKEGSSDRELTRKFPISTEEELIAVNKEIKDGAKEAYIQVIKSLLRPHGVLKNFKFIMTDNMATNYNIDGVLGKKSLKVYKDFLDALKDSVPFSDAGTSDEQIRKAIALAKKRVMKKKKPELETPNIFLEVCYNNSSTESLKD